jgi:hypothetical protein
MSTFASLLGEAKEETAAESKSTANLPKGGMIAGVLAYLEMLDDEGFSELIKFQEECLPSFRNCKSEEHSLQHTDMHARFCAMFEKRIDSFVQYNGWTIDDFYNMVRRELRDPATKTADSDDAKELLNFVKESADFQTWSESMRVSAKIKYWGDDDDTESELPSHTRGFINLPATEPRQYLD